MLSQKSFNSHRRKESSKKSEKNRSVVPMRNNPVYCIGKQAGTEPIHGCIFQESHTDAEPGRDELLMLIGKSHKKE